MTPKTRSEAKNIKSRYYFTGIPCKNGHIADRYTSTCACTECNKERSGHKKDWYQKNKQKTKLRVKKNYLRRRDEILRYSSEYQKRNLKKIINNRNERAQNDEVYALKERVRCLIKETIRNKVGTQKRTITSEILGCSSKEFKKHIQRQFVKGMSWDNFKEWHIDHIIPISSAKTEDEVYALNHHTNLRPLWAKDNLEKSNRVEFLI